MQLRGREICHQATEVLLFCKYARKLQAHSTDYTVELFILRGHRHFQTTSEVQLMLFKKQ
jgi:hypothetical protein